MLSVVMVNVVTLSVVAPSKNTGLLKANFLTLVISQ